MITLEALAAPEALFAVEYTPAERAQMLDTVEAQLASVHARRQMRLTNDMPMASRFDPRLPHTTLPQPGPLRFSPVDAPCPADDEDIAFAPVTHLAHWIATGALTSRRLTELYLRRIDALNPSLFCFATVTPERALAQADAADRALAAGTLLGPLHGIPYGVKDVFDTADMPTTQNSPLYPDLRTGRDAAAVAVARLSGGLILGKTDTVEFASGGRKALSRSPFNHAHTPGGSSSGSGAAVGDFHVPLAFGTQTGGSHIRPASFNGIYGLKPSWNVVSREGLKMASVTLDTVGWYGRSVDDLVLVAEAFRLLRAADATPPPVRGLRVGLCRSPVWDRIEPAGEAALLLAAERLAGAGAIVEDLALPSPCEQLSETHQVISYAEGSRAFLPEYLMAGSTLAPDLLDKAENRRGITPARLLEAYTLADRCRPLFDGLFGAALDVVLTPSAPGEAPEGLHTTGSDVFNRNWTLLHVPCVNVPVTRGPKGLPVGVTLVGPRQGDARLLEIAAALAPVIDTDPGASLRELFQ